MRQSFKKVFLREWRILVQSGSGWAQPWIYLLLVSLMPAMLVGERLKQLPILSAVLVWLAFVLSTMLTLDKTIRADHAHGTLAQWLTYEMPLWWLMMAKAIAHWALWVLPMILISPLIMLLLGLELKLSLLLFICLLIGTPILSFMGLLSASLTLSLQASGFLIAIILLPLIIPMILLGLSPIQNSLIGQDYSASLALLAALSILVCVLSPPASAFGVKVSQSCGSG